MRLTYVSQGKGRGKKSSLLLLLFFLILLSACMSSSPPQQNEKAHATPTSHSLLTPETTITPFPFETLSTATGWPEVLRLGNITGMRATQQGYIETKHNYQVVYVCQGTGSITVTLGNIGDQKSACTADPQAQSNRWTPVKDEQVYVTVTAEGDVKWIVSIQMSPD
ncbi:hypothetical protein [Tengunoibacter tsumagoiensis]|uniref:Lipoprotein n=1 Tax=Tengunoibacter tsumagoiensis TaxID=2014871 RepID=A0A402A3R5_9CHLR|nr:hypothetical protein [Tengunoibacter tsumagoiensis]GCE13686.1 hypothetical protein KTT_35450 [Tengunoibacter tsumagoiensis]